MTSVEGYAIWKVYYKQKPPKKMSEKLFLSFEGLMKDSFLLAKKILDSDFKPDFIVALWRGGSPIGLTIQEFLDYKGYPSDHIAIRTSRYEGMEAQNSIRIHGLDYIVERANAENKLLIVDDVFDSGITLRAVIHNIREKSRKNAPKEIKTATLYYKPSKNQTNLVPDFYLYSTDNWIVFPHELKGLSLEEIKKFKDPSLSQLF